jgi:hypothetical protein
MSVNVKMVSYRNPQRREWEIPVPDGHPLSVGALFGMLHGREPNIFANTDMKGVSILVGGIPKDRESEVSDGDRITFIEVITGG